MTGMDKVVPIHAHACLIEHTGRYPCHDYHLCACGGEWRGSCGDFTAENRRPQLSPEQLRVFAARFNRLRGRRPC